MSLLGNQPLACERTVALDASSLDQLGYIFLRLSRQQLRLVFDSMRLAVTLEPDLSRL